MIAATISVTQLAVPVLRPSRCYVCVMGGVRPAPRRRLVFERRVHRWAHRAGLTAGLTTGAHAGSPRWAHHSHQSLPLGSPLGLTAGLFSKGYLRRLELHRLLQRGAQAGVVHHCAPITGAATKQPKAPRRDGESGGDGTIKRDAVGGESEVETATARVTLDRHRDAPSVAKVRGTVARLLAW